MEEVERWIRVDESGTEMLSRVQRVRPFLLPPPLHRVPLRAGNVLELLGPSPSAKTHILIHVAISCILPKHWNGIHYGGFDHAVLFLDLDCRFDILRFSQILIHRIKGEEAGENYDKALYDMCMTRFLYVRCSDSFEFLQTLKTLHCRLEREKEVNKVNVHMLMIDSIGAFHWMDRASIFLSLKENNRKKLFLQSVSEAVVQDIKKLLQVHPMLVVATKSVIFGNRYSKAAIEVKGNFIKNNWEERSSRNVTRNHQHFEYREYMPSVWQSFVTHRILVRSSGWCFCRFLKHICGGMSIYDPLLLLSIEAGQQYWLRIFNREHPKCNYWARSNHAKETHWKLPRDSDWMHTKGWNLEG